MMSSRPISASSASTPAAAPPAAAKRDSRAPISVPSVTVPPPMRVGPSSTSFSSSSRYTPPAAISIGASTPSVAPAKVGLPGDHLLQRTQIAGAEAAAAVLASEWSGGGVVRPKSSSISSSSSLPTNPNQMQLEDPSSRRSSISSVSSSTYVSASRAPLSHPYHVASVPAKTRATATATPTATVTGSTPASTFPSLAALHGMPATQYGAHVTGVSQSYASTAPLAAPTGYPSSIMGAPYAAPSTAPVNQLLYHHHYHGTVASHGPSHPLLQPQSYQPISQYPTAIPPSHSQPYPHPYASSSGGGLIPPSTSSAPYAQQQPLPLYGASALTMSTAVNVNHVTTPSFGGQAGIPFSSMGHPSTVPSTAGPGSTTGLTSFVPATGHMPPNPLILKNYVVDLGKSASRDQLWRFWFGESPMTICRVCGEDVITRHLSWQGAHIISDNAGGKLYWWNVVPSCGCNQSCGSLHMIDFMDRNAGRRGLVPSLLRRLANALDRMNPSHKPDILRAMGADTATDKSTLMLCVLTGGNPVNEAQVSRGENRSGSPGRRGGTSDGALQPKRRSFGEILAAIQWHESDEIPPSHPLVLQTRDRFDAFVNAMKLRALH